MPAAGSDNALWSKSSLVLQTTSPALSSYARRQPPPSPLGIRAAKSDWMKTLVKLKKSIAGQLAASVTATRNALADAQILALLAPFGYGTETLTSGKVLCETAANKASLAAIRNAELEDAVAYAGKLEKDAAVACRALAKVACSLFARDPLVLEMLGLKARKACKEADLLLLAPRLFNTGLYTEAMRAQFARRGYRDERLSRERSKIEEFEHARENLTRSRHAAARATEEQEHALKDLGEWMAGFVRVAGTALRQKPQWLQKLGVKPPRSSFTATPRRVNTARVSPRHPPRAAKRGLTLSVRSRRRRA